MLEPSSSEEESESERPFPEGELIVDKLQVGRLSLGHVPSVGLTPIGWGASAFQSASTGVGFSNSAYLSTSPAASCLSVPQCISPFYSSNTTLLGDSLSINQRQQRSSSVCGYTQSQLGLITGDPTSRSFISSMPSTSSLNPASAASTSNHQRPASPSPSFVLEKEKDESDRLVISLI